MQDSVIEDSTSSSLPLSPQKLVDLIMGNEQNLMLLEVYLNLIIKLTCALHDNLSGTLFYDAWRVLLLNKLLNIRDSKHPSPNASYVAQQKVNPSY